MKSNKSIVVFSVILALASLFQLTFTFKARGFEQEAREFAVKKAKFGVSEKEAYRRYIDSLGNKDYYSFLGIMSYTYFECKEKELNLGLDLRGGMNVILEVEKDAIIRVLANDPTDADLLKALQLANIEVRDKGTDYVEAFVSSFKKTAPNRKLAVLFVKGNNSTIQAGSEEIEVKNYLQASIKTAVSNVKQVVEKRINQANVTQPNVQEVDGGRISVELPGVDNPRRMEELVEKSAQLEFYEVYGGVEGSKILNNLIKVVPGVAAVSNDTTATDSTTSNVTPVGKSRLASILKPFGTGQESSIATIKAADRELLEKMLLDEAYQTVLANNVKIAYSAKPMDVDANGKEVANSDEYYVYFLKKDRDGNAALASGDENIIEDARENTNQTGQIEVVMQMTPAAATRWAQVTGANVGKYIAIVLDNRVYSAPVVNQKITGGNSQISGNFDIREAQDLANVLKAGKLPAPARIVASEEVGASLGKASIDRGLNSLMIGFLSVVIFMVLYYNRAGWMAIVAVLGNVYLIFGVLSSLGAALTLPGIAGIILTVGMAVDANVLIYERIKDELASGKGIRTAIDLGFKHALSAIIDSNITTLLAGFILTFAGSGPAYGFAIILVIGIFSSMFTALFITRWLLENRASKGKEIAFDTSWNRNFLKGKNIDFVTNRKKYYIFSALFIVAGIIAFVMKGGITTGIDFKGGNALIIQFDPSQKYQTEDIKKTLDASLNESSNEVKSFGSEGQFKILSTYLVKDDSKEAREKVKTDVLESLNKGGFKLMTPKDAESPIVSSQRVFASIATETRNTSTVLVILAIVGIFLYIVLRFRSVAYGLGATIALIHDVLVVLSAFAILDGLMPFPTEFDQHLIAALLTLLGYSINDTVIVFDRIRESLATGRSNNNDNGLINEAINSTLSRTVVTSATVFFVLIVLFLFGGDALKGFSMALLIGVIAGTYSSICIATPIVVDFSSKKKQNN
ncbi:MAG: protein translocase subunit SecD [Bacteroidia bacterium]|nr:protein translocase subunit SecD [Bacteroidia bacterium]